MYACLLSATVAAIAGGCGDDAASGEPRVVSVSASKLTVGTLGTEPLRITATVALGDGGASKNAITFGQLRLDGADIATFHAVAANVFEVEIDPSLLDNGALRTDSTHAGVSLTLVARFTDASSRFAEGTLPIEIFCDGSDTPTNLGWFCADQCALDIYLAADAEHGRVPQARGPVDNCGGCGWSCDYTDGAGAEATGRCVPGADTVFYTQCGTSLVSPSLPDTSCDAQCAALTGDSGAHGVCAPQCNDQLAGFPYSDGAGVASQVVFSYNDGQHVVKTLDCAGIPSAQTTPLGTHPVSAQCCCQLPR